MAKILIVEDYPVTQRVLSLTLKNSGHEVQIANHGLEALQQLDSGSVDLALVDIAMPEMDGLELLRHLRNDARYQELPVIMLTASGQDEDRAIALTIGADGFLSKPTSSRELLDTINRFVG
ncbi:MAG: response regulator [Chloroflexi bacterium]|nr:response regulator [Chloroflexota bacterium]MCC6895380.1 response regulator [Anaerolineae bacterium]